MLVDENSDLIKLVEVGGLQEWKKVPHVGLLPGHGGVSTGRVDGGAFWGCPSLLACLEHSWGHPPKQSPGTSTSHQSQFTHIYQNYFLSRISSHMTTPTWLWETITECFAKSWRWERVWWLKLTWLFGYSRRRKYGYGGIGTSNS